jgi:hypothetical protein
MGAIAASRRGLWIDGAEAADARAVEAGFSGAVGVEAIAGVLEAVGDEGHAKIGEFGVVWGDEAGIFAGDRVAGVVEIDGVEIAALELDPGAGLAADPHGEGVGHAAAGDRGEAGEGVLDGIEAP